MNGRAFTVTVKELFDWLFISRWSSARTAYVTFDVMLHQAHQVVLLLKLDKVFFFLNYTSIRVNFPIACVYLCPLFYNRHEIAGFDDLIHMLKAASVAWRMFWVCASLIHLNSLLRSFLNAQTHSDEVCCNKKYEGEIACHVISS